MFFPFFKGVPTASGAQSIGGLRGGKLYGQEIIIAGGTQGIIKSENFETGVAGWSIFGDGTAELLDVAIRGSIFLGGTVADGEVVGDENGWTLPGYTALSIPELEALRSAIKWSEPGNPSNWNGGIQGLEDGSFITVGATDTAAIGRAAITDETIVLVTGQGLVFRNASPAIGFVGDEDTGLHRAGANQLAVYTGGTSRLTVSDSLFSSQNATHEFLSAAGTTILNIVTGTVIDMFPDGSTLRLRVDSGGIRPFTTTVANAANLVQTASGNLVFRSTSSARYKRKIQVWTEGGVRQLTPVTFKSRSSVDDPSRVFLGLTAEDVAANFPIAVNYDDEGRPDGIEWNSIIAGLLYEVQQLTARVKELENR